MPDSKCGFHDALFDDLRRHISDSNRVVLDSLNVLREDLRLHSKDAADRINKIETTSAKLEQMFQGLKERDLAIHRQFERLENKFQAQIDSLEEEFTAQLQIQSKTLEAIQLKIWVFTGGAFVTGAVLAWITSHLELITAIMHTADKVPK